METSPAGVTLLLTARDVPGQTPGHQGGTSMQRNGVTESVSGENIKQNVYQEENQMVLLEWQARLLRLNFDIVQIIFCIAFFSEYSIPH